ncbi:MAG: MOSC domain-containing protein [Gammaproteobacteria bacterium]|jgi:MOSC domain-containing protein YiiM|nr:MOSC domain-containing protein [Gammaproteobacteria bacterium]
MTLLQPQYRVLSVQIGTALPLQMGDRTVLSGIGKRTVEGPIVVNQLGLDGDEQADLTVHGGLSKAIYAYPAEHYPFWREQRLTLGLSTDLPYGTLGENLTLTGLLESMLYVGDTLCFPNCTLRVTQPREPCYKFNAVMGDPKAAKKMARSGFCGFYLAVESPGSIMAGQAFEVKPGQHQLPMMALFKTARARSIG